MNIIAETITRRRKELNMTQREMAEKLNVSDKTISRWETGNQVPDALMIPRLAEVLEINIHELYGVNDEKEKDVTKVESQSLAKEKNDFNVKMVLGTIFSSVGIRVLWGNNSGSSEVLLLGMLIIGIGLIAVANMTLKTYCRQLENEKLYEEVAMADNMISIAIVLFCLLLWR